MNQQSGKKNQYGENLIQNKTKTGEGRRKKKPRKIEQMEQRLEDKNPSISSIIIHVNGLNCPFKEQRLSGQFKKYPAIFC